MSADTAPAEQATAHSEQPASSSQTYTADQLRQDGKLWYKIHVFAYDLRNFRSNDKSQDRLNSVIDTYYIGPPYFSAAEAGRILQTMVDEDKTLREMLDEFFTQKLETRMRSRIQETGEYKVCAAHDLAPMIEKAFRVHPKDLSKNKAFMKLLNGKGLNALDEGGVWKGVGKR